MKIAVVAAAVLATIIPSTVDASHRQLSTTNNDNNNKPKRRRGQNAVLTSRVKSKVSNVVEIEQQREYTPRQLERDGIITRGVVRGEEQLSMQSIEEPAVAIIDEENTPTVIEQIDCNTMNKKQCKREDIQCAWEGQVCTSSAQVSFLQVDTCVQYTTQKKCRKNSPCEWQEGGEEGKSGSCNTPGFVNGIIKPQSNAPTTYSPTTPYPSYFPTLFPTLSPSLSPDLSISMSMMTFLEEEETEEESNKVATLIPTNWPTYFPTLSPTLSNIPSDFPITSNPTVSPSTFKPTDSPSESPHNEVLPELILEESNECTGLAWRACKRNPLCDIISKNTECYLISEGNDRRHLEVSAQHDRCTYRTQEKNCIRTVGCTWAGMRGCVDLDLLNHVVPPPLMLDTPRSDVCPDTLTYLKEIDTSATLHYALVPSTTSSSGYLCGRLEVRNHEGWV